MKRKLDKRKKAALAYVVGVSLGDGNLSNPNGRAVRLRVTCDVKYPCLAEKIKTEIQSVFPNNRVSTTKVYRNSFNISCYSNEWENILGWKAKGGSKFFQNADIPKWIFEKNLYLINCLKGLIETDGSIYTDRGHKMVMFTSIIPSLVKSVMLSFERLGFKPHLYKFDKWIDKEGYKRKVLYHIRLAKDVKKFLKMVKPEKN